MKRGMTGLGAMAGMGAVLLTATTALADPTQECDAAYRQTQLARRAGKLLEARKQALVCGAPACPASVKTDCTQWVAELDASLPTVVFAAEDAAGRDTLAVRLLIDGKPFADKLDSKAVPLDPGTHVVRFEMAGADPIEQQLVIREGEKNRRIAVAFKKEKGAPPIVAPPPPPVVPEPAPAPPPANGGGGVPTWAWISGGAGLVLLGVGAGFGGSALSAQGKLADTCANGDLAKCRVLSTKQQDAKDLASQRDLGRNAFIGLAAAGVVGIGAAIVGIVRAPSKKAEPPPAVAVAPYGSPAGGGLALNGVFR